MEKHGRMEKVDQYQFRSFWKVGRAVCPSAEWRGRAAKVGMKLTGTSGGQRRDCSSFVLSLVMKNPEKFPSAFFIQKQLME